MSFNNFSRALYEDSLNFLAQNCFKMKKKELVKLLSKCSDEEQIYIEQERRSRFNTSINDNTFYCLHDVVNLCWRFKEARRFFIAGDVANIDTDDYSMDYILPDSTIMMVEALAGGINVLAVDTNCEEDIYIEGVKVKHKVDIYIDYNSNKTCIGLYESMKSVVANDRVKRNVLKYVPFMHILRGEDNDHMAIQITPENAIVWNSDICKDISAIYDNEECTIRVVNVGRYSDPTIDKRDCNLLEVCAGIAANAIVAVKHATECYEGRKTIQRRNGKKRKSYESHKVHIAHNSIVEDEDILVPLHTYVKEYEPSVRGEYKGGHHASPIEHDRAGHYRKSRGRGDYNLVNGEFVYVGNKEGSYSYVSPSHVTGRTRSVVYKI